MAGKAVLLSIRSTSFEPTWLAGFGTLPGYVGQVAEAS
jgi:hypothetical protein